MPDSVEANRVPPHRVSLANVTGFSASPTRGNCSYRKVAGGCPDVGPLAGASLRSYIRCNILGIPAQEVENTATGFNATVGCKTH